VVERNQASKAVVKKSGIESREREDRSDNQHRAREEREERGDNTTPRKRLLA
jgi:hypothetical protein